MSQSNDGNFDRDGVTPADQRPDAVSAPVPLPVGIFLVQPRVDFSGGFTSNLFASDINEEEASFVGFAPSFEVSSDWTRHALGGMLEIDHLEVSDNSAESRTNVRLGVDGQFDISDSTRLTGKLLSEDINEDRTDISAIEGSIEPNEFSSLRGGLAMHHTGKTWQILADLDYASYDHDDVELPGDLFQDQDFRDKDEISGRLCVAYALSPNWAAYTQAQHVEADFDPPGFFNAFNRDYEGNTLSVGSDFAHGDAVSGDIAIGFMSYAFDDPFFEDIDDVSVSGNVQWALADQTTLETELRRAVVDPGIVETIAAIETGVSVRLAHGLKLQGLPGRRSGI